MRNLIKKITSIIMALMTIIGIFTVNGVSASAASATYYIKPGEYRLESAYKSKVMLNLWGNQSVNMTSICTWSNDWSDEQVTDFKYEGNGAYRIYFRDHTRCVDVLRYTSPLKAGQKVELYDDNDSIAQLIVPYRINNNTVILRMKSNTNLAISIKNAKNGTQLVLEKFDKNNKKQQWVFRSPDKNFKKVSAFTTTEPTTKSTASTSKDLNNIPSSYYKHQATYTVSGVKYKYCVTTKKYGNITKGTKFFKTNNNALVTNKNTLNKLQTILLLNSVKETYIDLLDTYSENAQEVYNCCARWNRNQELTTIIGKAGGAGLRAIFDCTVGDKATGVINFGQTIITAYAEPEDALAAATIITAKGLTVDTVYYCKEARTLLKKSFTDYDSAKKAINAVAKATGNYYGLMHIGRPILSEIISSNPWQTTLDGMTSALMSGMVGDSLVLKATDIVSHGLTTAEFCKFFGITSTYNTNYNNIRKALLLG